jgi:HEAT repeats
MNSFVVGVIALIAGIFAAILFGRPQAPRDQTPATIAQVEPPDLPRSTIPDMATSQAPIGQLPVTELPAATLAAEPLFHGATPLARSVAMGAIGSASSPSMPPFAAIQDPKRPRTPDLQDLSQAIINLGMAQKLSNVPQLLQYRKHAEPMIRCYVAHAMGQIAAAHTVKSEIQSTIPFLGELARDPDREVQQMALKALSRVQSPDVLPYLEQGLLTASAPVKQVLNAAIQQLKSPTSSNF